MFPKVQFVLLPQHSPGLLDLVLDGTFENKVVYREHTELASRRHYSEVIAGIYPEPNVAWLKTQGHSGTPIYQNQLLETVKFSNDMRLLQRTGR